MARLTLGRPLRPEDMQLFKTRMETLKHVGPDVIVHVLQGGRQQAIVFAWSDGMATETPSFRASGTVDQTFQALKAWFANEGWLRSS